MVDIHDNRIKVKFSLLRSTILREFKQLDRLHARFMYRLFPDTEHVAYLLERESFRTQ